MKKATVSSLRIGIASLAAGGSLALVSCNEETAGSSTVDPALVAKLEALEEEQETLKTELEDAQEKAKEKKKEIEAAKKEHEATLVELQQELREAKKENEKLKTDFQQYREDYKVSIRKKANGIELGEVALASGPKYLGVVVSKWTPDALRVTHAGGNATLPFEQLPNTIQTMFQYDPDETEELLAKGDEAAVSTGKPTRLPTDTVASLSNEERWPTKDPNGKPAKESTGKEFDGFLNGPETQTNLDKAISRYDQIIASGEKKINELDKQISEAVRRGSEGAQRSLERKTERLMDQIKDLRAKRSALLDKRHRLERRS